MAEKIAAERVALARHPQRPNITDYIDGLFTDFFEQRGDRACREDPAILGGIALFHGRPVTVIGTRKGKTLEENLRCNFGMPGPEGYRKALRLMNPVWHGGGHREAELLASCYENSMALALELGCRTVAFPAISTGVYHYPLEEATRIAVQTVRRFLAEHRGQTLTREQLLDRVWDGGEFVDENALSVAVNRLRRKLGEAPIRTVYGVGYVWAEG